MNDRLHGWAAMFIAVIDAAIAICLGIMLFTGETAAKVVSGPVAADDGTTGVAFAIFLWMAIHWYFMVRSGTRDI